MVDAGQGEVQHRPSARAARRRWADEVTQALKEQRLSIHAAAKAIGISPGRLQAWLSQDVEPSPRVMPALARTIGRGHLHLLQLLDWLPAGVSDIPWRLEATTKLNAAMAEAQRWLRGATQAVGLHGGSLVAGALLEASQDWQIAVRNSIRGQRYPIRYAIRVGVSAVGPDSGLRSGDTTTDRARVEHLISETLRRTSATWLSPDRMTGQTWAVRPDLVLTVPALCASRPLGLRPNLSVPPALAVVGVPYTGTREVAALIADLLDWAYVDVAALAMEQFGLDSDTPADVIDLAQVSVARRLLRDPAYAGQRTVWSFGEPGPILRTIRELEADVPLVVQLRGSESLLMFLSGASGGGPGGDEVETAQNVVRRTLQSGRAEGTYRILDVPDLPLTGASPDDLDAIFDLYVECAFQVATWLHERHGGPPLPEAAGLLGNLWRGRIDDA